MTAKPPADHDQARLVARKVAARLGFYIATCLIAVFFALPLLWLLSAPFDSTPGFAVSLPEFTVDNFSQISDNRYALGSLFNSILLAAGTTAFVVVGAALAYYALSRVRIPGRDALLYILLLLSSVVTGTAAMVPLFRQQPQGLLAIGSFESDHFKSSLGTLFINHIGEVLSRRLADFLPMDGNAQARRA